MESDDRHNSVPGHHRWHEPDQWPRGVAVLAPAMATPSRYYAAFADWADNGVRTLTFDHPGSRDRAAMRAYDGDLLDWFDHARDVLDAVARSSDGVPITWVGHSLGSQMLPFVDHDLLDRVVSVAAGVGWVGHLPGILRWTAPVMLRTVAPIATRVAGYYPGRTIRQLDDVPAGVMRQWTRWCLHRGYLDLDVVDAADAFAQVKTPMTVLSFTDDEIMSAAAVGELHDRFVNADRVPQRYSPAQLGVEWMGHHGFFRAAHRKLCDELVLPFVARH
jgi:predicted alpha/beta hydrolase